MDKSNVAKQDEFSLKDFVYEIFKRRSGYFFGNNWKSDCKKSLGYESCLVDIDECPYFNNQEDKIDLTRFIKCYFKSNNKFHGFLKDNGYIVATPLFRVQKLNPQYKIEYSGGYWYPFRTNESFIDPLINENYYKEVIQTNLCDDQSEIRHLSKLRWDITQRRNTVIEESISFDLFEKVESSNYAKDNELKYLDVCDGYATFQIIYFVIAQRFLSGLKIDNFNDSITWEVSRENEYLLTYLKKNPNGRLNLSVRDKRIFRTSSWKEDLELLGLIDCNGIITAKYNLLDKWLKKDNQYSDQNITRYKDVLKNAIKFEKDNNYIKVINTIKFDNDARKNFTLTPEIHLFVRAYWITPVRWFFLPMGTDFDEINNRVISTSGVILVLTDNNYDAAYNPVIPNEESIVVKRVKNLLPIVYAIHNIENKSFEDYINRERIRITKEQIKHATNAGISQVMARNTSHNIGAHVMNKLIDRKGLSELDISKFINYKSTITLSGEAADKFTQIAYFNNYVKCRMDYLADVTFGTPMMQTNFYAYRDLFKELDKVRLLLENITGLSNFPYRISFTKNGIPLSEFDDLLVALPNDILGMQAFYNILENIIRNTAKHSKRKPVVVEFTVNFRDEADTSVNKEIQAEQANILRDLIIVEVFDNVIIEGIEDATQEQKIEYKEILAKQKKVDVDTIEAPNEKIDWLVYNQNNRLDANILEDNKLRTSSLGVIEMDASAAYLRKRDVSFINHENYSIFHDEFCSSHSIAAHEDESKRGINCRNFFKAFKKSGIESNYFKYDENGQIIKDDEDKPQAESKTGSVLGYRFFLLRPQVVLIVTNTYIQTTKKNEFKKAGIWIKNQDEFKTELENNIVYSHDFVVYSEVEETILQKFKTALPIRMFNVNSDKVDELNKDYIFFEGNKGITKWEVFCWIKTNDLLYKRTSCIKFENGYHFHFSVKNSFNNYACNSLVFLDHLYKYNGEEKTNAEIYNVWHEHKDKRYYIEALSSTAQSRMPNFSQILLDKIEEENKSTERFKTYLGNLDSSTKTKIIEAALSKVLVIDERIQEAASRTFMGISYNELFNRMNVMLPSKTEDNIDLGANSFDRATSKKIRAFVFNLIKSSNDAIHIESNKNNEAQLRKSEFLLIHYSILERIYGDKKSINIRLEKLASITNVIVTSGRGVPDDLSPKVRFVNLSSIVTAFVEIRSKYIIYNLLAASRKTK